MAYGSVEGVQAMVPAAGALSSSSTPTAVEVTIWLEEGAVIIDGALGTAGYVTPVETSMDAYAMLRGLNNLWAAAWLLRALGIDTASGESENRSKVWFDEFWTRLAMLASGDLTLLDLTLLPGGTARPRGMRTRQIRRVDGYSGQNEGIALEYDYVSE